MTHAALRKPRSAPYCGERIRKWKEKNGVGVFTLIPPDLAQAIKREALTHKKPQWKLIRACITYGFQTGNETRVLRAYIDTPNKRESKISDGNRLTVGALRHGCERRVRTVTTEPYLQSHSPKMFSQEDWQTGALTVL